MTRQETVEAVTVYYTTLYPKWTNILVTEVVLDTFGGNIAVVRATDEKGHDNEEMCFSYPERTVRHFTTTEELARFLEAKAKAGPLERVFTRPILSGIIFLVLLIFVFIIGFWHENYSPESLAILGSVVGLAAGYFFSSNPKT